MKGRLLLLDITEMSGANVCIAGIDPDTGRQVRLSDPTPTRAQVRRLGLRTGDLIELEYDLLRRPAPPHVEDARWRPERLKIVEHLSLPAMLDIVRLHSFPSVVDAFGEPIERAANGNFGWPPGQGERSLATVTVRYVRISVKEKGGVRAALRDGEGASHYFGSTPFQDLVVKTHDEACDGCAGPDRERLIKEAFDCNSALIRLGLTRGYPRVSGEPERCWLQVTNIFARERAHFV